MEVPVWDTTGTAGPLSLGMGMNQLVDFQIFPALFFCVCNAGQKNLALFLGLLILAVLNNSDVPKF